MGDTTRHKKSILYTIRDDFIYRRVGTTWSNLIIYYGTWIELLYFPYYLSILLCHMILVTIISAYILLKYQINKYAGDPTKEIKKSNQSKYMLLLSTAPGLGYLS